MADLPRFVACLCAAFVVVGCTVSAQEVARDGFPFVVPYDGLVEGTAPAALAAVPAPAGAEGFVEVKDGSPYGEFVLSETGRPIRFWGTNLCFGACFPPHDVAERMAGRMASLGINCVRFHHMDASGYPRGIWENEGWGDFEHTTLDPEALDRLDYLIAQLKRHGIYTNLNLHVSRTYGQKDGFPAVGEGERVPNYGKGVDNFYPRCIQEQKRYARMLLRHVNQYTGNAYAEEPAIAMVEISNEDGLLREWRSGGLDRLPEPYVQELQSQWNEWLAGTYDSTEELRAAWSEGAAAGRDEDMLAAPGVRPSLQVTEDARASLDEAAAPDGSSVATITVHQPSPISWHVQYMWARFSVRKGTTYLLRMKLRANRAAEVSVDCRLANEPWSNLGLSQGVTAAPEWRSHEFYFAATQDVAEGARITLSRLSQEGLRISVAGVSLQAAAVHGLAPGEEVGTGGVPWPSRRELAGRTPAFRRDEVRFLRDTEVAYWRGMCDYLHNDLDVKMPVTGTAIGYTTSHIAAETVDFVDSHAYWQHPYFPGRPWDPGNWIIRPDVMVNNPERSTIAGLAPRRVFGLPYTVTEYNHPSPHRHEAEGFPLIAVYGAFQAWNGIFPFTYASGERWETDHVSGFFNIAPDPVKLAVHPACSDLFRSGKVRPPSKVIPTRLSLDEQIEGILNPRGWGLQPYPEGLDPLAWQEARLGHVAGPEEPAVSSGPGSELKWEVHDGRGLVTYVGEGCAGMIGFGAGQSLRAGRFIVTPGATALDGFSVVMINSVEGRTLGAPGRYLITAATRWWNRGMVWNEAGDSVGRNWGSGPTLCEGVPVELSFNNPGRAARLFSLAPDGTRREEVPGRVRDGDTVTFELGPCYRTLWYELVIAD